MTHYEIELPDELQPYADRIIEALDGEPILYEHEHLEKLTSWCDDGNNINEVVVGTDKWIHAPDLRQFIFNARQSFNGDHEPAAILAHLDELIEAALGGWTSYWGFECTVPIAGTLRHSDSRTALIVFELIDYLSGPFTWYGVFSDRAVLNAWLEDQGRVVTHEQFRAIPQQRLLEVWNKLENTTDGWAGLGL